MSEPDVLLREARAAYAQNDLGKAAALYRNVLAGDPSSHAEALEGLSLIAQRMGKPALALELVEACLQLAPLAASALTNKAVLLRQVDKKEEAWQAALVAIQKAPLYANAWHTCAYLALERKEYPSALTYAKEAVRLEPASAQFAINLVSALMVNQFLQEAHQVAVKAVQLNPNDPSAHLVLAQVLRACGRADLAVFSFDQVLALNPDFLDAKMGKAAALSVMGDWQQAWPLWEQRYRSSLRDKDFPVWRGDKVKSLLIYAEQGLGDTLQFSRWIPASASLAEVVFFQVQPALKKIISRAFPAVHVIAPEDPLPDVEAQSALFSLPKLFSLTPLNVPHSLTMTPYVEMREKWRAYLAARPTRQIGMVWQGNAGHANDYNRSIPKAAFDFLKTSCAGHFISLQNGQVCDFFADDQKDLIPLVLGQDGVDSRVDAIAALMVELDLVITVDTMPLHLAGCLGAPTWALLPFDPDWRWGYEGESTVWYPSVRVFRQTKPGSWAEVLDSVKEQLDLFFAGQKDVLTPKQQSGFALLKRHPFAEKIVKI